MSSQNAVDVMAITYDDNDDDNGNNNNNDGTITMTSA